MHQMLDKCIHFNSTLLSINRRRIECCKAKRTKQNTRAKMLGIEMFDEGRAVGRAEKKFIKNNQ